MSGESIRFSTQWRFSLLPGIAARNVFSCSSPPLSSSQYLTLSLGDPDPDADWR